ncbi:MAG: hypothetical protein QXQ19_02490 [Candidatus Aenigmatarchaeota archaeon]
MFSDKIDKLFILREKKQHMSFYEKIIIFLSKFFIYKVPKYLEKKYNYLIFHNKYKITPNQIFSASINIFLIFFLLSILIYHVFLPASVSIAFELFLSIILTGITLSVYLLIFPFLHKKIIKMIVISESIWVLSYIIINLRNNPNLENAILFVATNLNGYLPSEFFELIYDLETKRFSSLDEAISFYSKRWKEWFPDFAYLMSVILNIKRMSNPVKIHELLDKIQDWYFKIANIRIKSYSSYLKGKVVLISMFLILLPLIGLILIPIIAVFIPESLKFVILFYLYDVLLPIISLLIVSQIISEMPYSISVFYKEEIEKQKSNFNFLNKLQNLFIIFLAIFFSVPSIIHFLELIYNIYVYHRYPDAMYILVKQETSIQRMINIYSIVFGLGISLGLYFYLKSYKKVNIIKKLERIESELPMLVNMIENSTYSGLTFEKSLLSIAENYRIVNPSGYLSEFIEKILNNIYRLRVNIRDAVFNPNYGAIKYFPSILLREVFNLIISASEKSLSALELVSRKVYKYLTEIVSLKEELNLSLTDPIMTLKMVCYVLVPIFGGLIISSHKLFINVIIFVGQVIKELTPVSGMYNFWDLYLQELFRINNLLPPTVFVIPIGIFLIEILFISAYFISGLTFGFNKIVRDYEIGKLLILGTIMMSLIYIISLFIVESILYSLISIV